jgi:Uma2 family endonuclease
MSVARNAAAPFPRRAISRRPVAVVARPPRVPENQVMLIPGTWNDYLKLDAQFTGTGLRVTYLEGIIELMSISPLHEVIKQTIGHLVVEYCLHRGLFFGHHGGPTHKRKKERAAEPDDSFIFERGRELPQLVIEVALTSGGLDKLRVWAGWPIEEVWIWKKGKLHFHRWQGAAYAEEPSSKLVPGFKKEWAERFAARRDTFDMIREFKAVLK